MLTPEENARQAERLRAAVQSGSINTADRTTLSQYNSWLCQQGSQAAFNDAGEHHNLGETVRFHMLRAMIDAFEERSAIQAKLVVTLAVAAILAQVLPYFIAPDPILSTKPSPTESVAGKAQDTAQFPVRAAPAPISAQLPSSSPASSISGSGVTKK